MDSNFSDIATALTQSLATTGVSTMTGPFKAAAGNVAAPGITFNGAPATGFYLAGTNQIGWASNGIQGATLNADTSVNFAGNVTIAGILSGLKGSIPVGAVTDFAGATPPSGWLLCFGQLVSTTTYSLLFAQLSTTYGSGSGTFGIPDYRGRAPFGQDNMGGSAAGRISVAGGNFDGTVLGGTGGAQNQTLSLSQTPTGITAGGSGSFGGNVPVQPSGTWGNGNTASSSGLSIVLVSNTVSNISSVSVSTTSNNTGGASHPILSNAIITNKIIYAGV